MAADPASRLEALLRNGLDLYAMNRFDEAARCWREARGVDPTDPRAEEYLAALAAEGHDGLAGPEATTPALEAIERRDPAPTGLRAVVEALGDDGPEAPALPETPALDKAQFVALLRERRFEEALDALYRMRKVAPDNASVSRGIQLLKQKLHAQHLQALGRLDRVPARSPEAGRHLAEAPPTATQRQVLELVDGISTTADLLESSSAGRFATARAIAQLLGRGVLTFSAPAGAAAPVRLAAVPDAPAAPSYDELFREATEAYLRRDLPRALALFQRCQAQRPDDRRVAHNIERLEARMRHQ